MNIPGGFPEIKLQPRGGGKDSSCSSLSSPCAVMRQRSSVGSLQSGFSLLFYTFGRANLVTKHLFFFFRLQNRQINEAGQSPVKEMAGCRTGKYELPPPAATNAEQSSGSQSKSCTQPKASGLQSH